MRFLNILTVAILFALASCSNEGESKVQKGDSATKT